MKFPFTSADARLIEKLLYEAASKADEKLQELQAREKELDEKRIAAKKFTKDATEAYNAWFEAYIKRSAAEDNAYDLNKLLRKITPIRALLEECED